MNVRIKHPKTEGVAVVPERAFLRVHQAKGWQLAEQPNAPETPGAPPAPERPQENDKTEAWRDYAVQRGMTPEHAGTQSRTELIAYFDRIDPQES